MNGIYQLLEFDPDITAKHISTWRQQHFLHYPRTSKVPMAQYSLRMLEPSQQRILLQRVESCGRISRFVAKPDDNPETILVDLRHQLDLVITFSRMALRNTDLVNPDVFFVVFIIAKRKKKIVQILANFEVLPIDQDERCRRWRTPGIGQC